MASVFQFEAIGTGWQIDIRDQLSSTAEAAILQHIQTRISLFDKTYSRFRSDSWVTTLAHEGGTYALPEDALPLFQIYEQLYRLSNGAFTPLIGQVMVEAGYDAQYSLRPGTLTPPPTWTDVLSYDADSVTLRQPAWLDFGAAGKGYLIDLVGQVLETHGLQDFTIDAGGDVLHQSPTGHALRVGLENPEDVGTVIGVAQLTGGSLCGSAGNRRAWADFHHIINPHTLASPRHILAIWAIAETTLIADAMATCLFFTPADTLLAHYRFSYLIVKADHTLEMSPDFPAEIFVA